MALFSLKRRTETRYDEKGAMRKRTDQQQFLVRPISGLIWLTLNNDLLRKRANLKYRHFMTERWIAKDKISCQRADRRLWRCDRN